MENSRHLDLDPEVEQRIQQLAGFSHDVLVTGPSGSGKSAIAGRIHELSTRHRQKFVAQNCGAIPGELAESTLFGHERGSFTSAHKDVVGIVAAANGGTLFLDEIGELSLAVQAKLLTLLQDRVYRPVGSTNDVKATFRLIAATNRDLLDHCNRGLFRQDLYHRINVLTVTLPPLRSDPEKARRIAAREVESQGMSPERAAQVLSVVANLSRHPAAWPGNVRELLTFVKRCSLDIQEEENRIRKEWERWREQEGPGHLTGFAPSVSPSLADRARYAEMIHALGADGGRRKAAVARKGSLELASRLLDAYPEALSLEDVQAVLRASDSRTLKANVELLVKHGLVARVAGGIVALWPPATSTIFTRHGDEWVPAGSGEIPAVAAGERIRIEVTSKQAGALGIMMVTHRAKRSPEMALITSSKDLPASKPTTVEIELHGAGGLEQILLHVRPPGQRGGRLVEPIVVEGVMPDSTALELGRRMALETWKEGWLAEHLLFHTKGR